MTTNTAVRLDQVLYLTCLVCGRTHDPAEVAYVCPDHGDDGILDVVYDYDRIAARISPALLADVRDPSIWRYGPLLPVDPDVPRPPLRVGGTPLYDAPRLAAPLGVASVMVKDEGVQPTGSLKDRASAIALVKAAEQSATVVATASTGNAAAALAGLAASTGQRTVIFVPATAPEAKVAQLLAFGAVVLLIDGGYGTAVELCLEASRAFGWYDRTTGHNPYMSEGKRTVAFEIAEQLNWQVPDAVLVPVGDGCIIGSLHKGFHDLVELGWAGHIPRLIGVQAEGSAYLADAWRRDEDVLTKPPIAAATIADSISADLPRDRLKALRAVRASGGAFLTVTDEQILAAIPALARATGVLAEPAAAAAWAGAAVAREQGHLGADDRVVVLSTGTGLKDVPAVLRAVAGAGVRPHRIAGDLGAVEAAVAGGVR